MPDIRRGPTVYPASQPREANELESGLRKARKKLVDMGHPEGHPYQSRG